MAEETANENIPGKNNLEKEEPSGLQKKIEEKIAEDEKNLQGEVLSGELSKDRTHMSEHRTDLSEHRTGLSEKRTGMSVTRTNLSFERTALSYERTLMSWIRTATSLISFGFTIYKFFEEFQKENPRSSQLLTPRTIGMIMIGFGVIGLLFAQIQHGIAYRKLKQEYPQVQRSLSSILSILLLAVGLLLFWAALFRQ